MRDENLDDITQAIDASLAAKAELEQGRVFEAWLRDPLTKFALSRVPPTEDELMRTLLRSCFDTGANIGRGRGRMEGLSEMLKSLASMRKR